MVLGLGDGAGGGEGGYVLSCLFVYIFFAAALMFCSVLIFGRSHVVDIYWYLWMHAHIVAYNEDTGRPSLTSLINYYCTQYVCTYGGSSFTVNTVYELQTDFITVSYYGERRPILSQLRYTINSTPVVVVGIRSLPGTLRYMVRW